MINISNAKQKEKKLIKEVERAVYARLGQTNFFAVDLAIVDEETICQFNSDTRGKKEVTDVLSYPYFEGLNLPVQMTYFNDASFDGRYVALGSIMICRQRAVSQAEEYGHSYERELGFLTCHGLLHLLGFDHEKEEDDAKMTALQEEIMKNIGLER